MKGSHGSDGWLIIAQSFHCRYPAISTCELTRDVVLACPHWQSNHGSNTLDIKSDQWSVFLVAVFDALSVRLYRGVLCIWYYEVWSSCNMMQLDIDVWMYTLGNINLPKQVHSTLVYSFALHAFCYFLNTVYTQHIPKIMYNVRG